MEEELTANEKAILMGNLDLRTNDYDHEFYEKMNEIQPMRLDEVDERVRRAILRFIMQSKDETVGQYGGLVMMGFIHGYMVGRKVKRDITRKAKRP